MILGNCEINKFKKFKFGKNIVNENNKYFYFYYISKKNTYYQLPKNYLCTLFIVKKNKNNQITINNSNVLISDGCSINNIKNNKIYFKNSSTHFILVGSKYNKKIRVKKTNYNNYYKVTKPWGYELWINGENSKHVLKEIFIKKGFKTSLQFHEIKSETNLLYSGHAKLVYKKNKKIKNLRVSKKDLASFKLSKYTIVNVKPYTLHRIIALSNIKLFEVSTNHLDDVIRVSDDANRQDGRISSEHKK